MNRQALELDYPLADTLPEEGTALEIAPGGKRPLDLHQTTFAMDEAIARLHLLWLKGPLKRPLTDDGIYRFSAR